MQFGPPCSNSVVSDFFTELCRDLWPWVKVVLLPQYDVADETLVLIPLANADWFSADAPRPRRGECLYVWVDGLEVELGLTTEASLLGAGPSDVGDTVIGEGEGVRASGLSGILCTLLRLLGDLRHWRLLLRPCKEPGLPEVNELAGEFWPLDRGELLADE